MHASFTPVNKMTMTPAVKHCWQEGLSYALYLWQVLTQLHHSQIPVSICCLTYVCIGIAFIAGYFFPTIISTDYSKATAKQSCIRPNEWKIKWRALKLTTWLFPQLMAVVSPHWMSLTSLIIQTFPFFFLKMNVKSFQTAHQIPASKSSTNLGKTLYWSFCSGLTVPKHMAPCRISYWIFSGWQPRSNSPRTHKVQLSPIILNSWIDSLLNSLKLPWVYRFSKVYILFLWLFSEHLGISKHKYEG